jgi:hypothetical protein
MPTSKDIPAQQFVNLFGSTPFQNIVVIQKRSIASRSDAFDNEPYYRGLTLSKGWLEHVILLLKKPYVAAIDDITAYSILRASDSDIKASPWVLTHAAIAIVTPYGPVVAYTVAGEEIIRSHVPNELKCYLPSEFWVGESLNYFIPKLADFCRRRALDVAAAKNPTLETIKESVGNS